MRVKVCVLLYSGYYCCYECYVFHFIPFIALKGLLRVGTMILTDYFRIIGHLCTPKTRVQLSFHTFSCYRSHLDDTHNWYIFYVFWYVESWHPYCTTRTTLTCVYQKHFETMLNGKQYKMLCFFVVVATLKIHKIKTQWL